MGDQPGTATAADDAGVEAVERASVLQSCRIVTRSRHDGLWNVRVRGIVKRRTACHRGYRHASGLGGPNGTRELLGWCLPARSPFLCRSRRPGDGRTASRRSSDVPHPRHVLQSEHAAGGNSGEECLGVVCVTQGSLSQLNDDGARDCATLTSRLRNPFSRAVVTGARAARRRRSSAGVTPSRSSAGVTPSGSSAGVAPSRLGRSDVGLPRTGWGRGAASTP